MQLCSDPLLASLPKEAVEALRREIRLRLRNNL